MRNKNKSTSIADLFWPGSVLVELKRRGEDLRKHYQQTLEYWIQLVPDRPKYVVLCNFDELWVYDLNRQLDEPVGRVATKDLPTMWETLAFLYNTGEEPVFGNDLVEVTRSAAEDVARLLRSLINRAGGAAPGLAQGGAVTGPGRPPAVTDQRAFVTTDRVTP